MWFRSYLKYKSNYEFELIKDGGNMGLGKDIEVRSIFVERVIE